MRSSSVSNIVTSFGRFVNHSGRKQKPGGMLLIWTAHRLVFFYILKMFLDFFSRANGSFAVFTLCTFGISHALPHKFFPGLDAHQAQERTAQCGDGPEQDN